MGRWRREVALGLGLLAGVLLRDAHAQAGSALVLEKNGRSEPELQPYSEIRDGSTVSLTPGARLVFLHYGTCRIVTVVGGRIAMAAHTYTVTGAPRPHEVRAPCPQKARLKDETDTAGVTARAGPPALRLSATPTFVLTGSRADEFATVRISRGETALMEAPLAGRKFGWPADAAPLAADDYEVAFVPRAPGKPPMIMRFRVEGERPAPSGQPVTLIQVEE